MMNEQNDISSKSASSATYRPWFNSKVSTYPIAVVQWVHWQINQGMHKPHDILQSIWQVVSQRINEELNEKMRNPFQLRADLLSIIRKYEHPTQVDAMEKGLNELPNTELRLRANEIYLAQYKMDSLERYCATLSRKKIVLTMELINIKNEGTQDEWEAWEKKRSVALSQQTNEYMNEAVTRKLLQLKSHIIKNERCDFFDIHFIKHIVGHLFRQDFQKLRALYPITQKELFNESFQSNMRDEYNIRSYWWYGALLFGLISAAVSSATFAGLSERGQERFNPLLENFWELESHDPIFRGAGFGLFGVALVLLWMLHPVAEQPAQRRALVKKVN